MDGSLRDHKVSRTSLSGKVLGNDIKDVVRFVLFPTTPVLSSQVDIHLPLASHFDIPIEPLYVDQNPAFDHQHLHITPPSTTLTMPSQIVYVSFHHHSFPTSVLLTTSHNVIPSRSSQESIMADMLANANHVSPKMLEMMGQTARPRGRGVPCGLQEQPSKECEQAKSALLAEEKKRKEEHERNEEKERKRREEKEARRKEKERHRKEEEGKKRD